MSEKQEWFASWFDSPYYHILYKNRDVSEAKPFLELLTKTLDLACGTTVLDLACGAGRHSKVLHELGFNVSGCDLSPHSIEKAKKLYPDIAFFVQDMRDPLPGKYSVVFNLFTSFGYFDQITDNALALKNVFEALNPNGLLVIDFMNSGKVCRELKRRQEVEKDGIRFHIKKDVVNSRIIKSIAFEDKGQSYFFQEKVQALDFMDFQQLLGNAGFHITGLYGDYLLHPFDEDQSDRLILVARKEA